MPVVEYSTQDLLAQLSGAPTLSELQQAIPMMGTDPDRIERLKSPDVEIAEVDLNDAPAVASACSGADCVISALAGLRALDVQSTERQAFGEADLTVLQTLADQVAIAISNARLVRRVQESLEIERRANGERILGEERG